MIRRSLPALLVLAGLPLLAAALPDPGAGAARSARESAAAEPVRSVTVFVVRHAEAADDGSRDPALAEAGRARADELARLLGHAGVTHAFATSFARTRETLAPLARAAGIEVASYPAGDARALAATLSALPAGSVAVVAGHSNTVPAIVRALGGELPGLTGLEEVRGTPTLPHDAYDRLFAVTVLRGESASTCVNAFELRYGD